VSTNSKVPATARCITIDSAALNAASSSARTTASSVDSEHSGREQQRLSPAQRAIPTKAGPSAAAVSYTPVEAALMRHTSRLRGLGRWHWRRRRWRRWRRWRDFEGGAEAAELGTGRQARAAAGEQDAPGVSVCVCVCVCTFNESIKRAVCASLASPSRRGEFAPFVLA
jgi:hypothetical protein